MDDSVDTVSPEVFWEAYTAVCQTIGKENFESDEHFRAVVITWARVQQRYLNSLARQDSENNSNN